MPIAVKIISSRTWYIHLLWIDENGDMHDDRINTSIPNAVTWVTYTRSDILYG